jgi:hypothetical protein
MHQYKVTCLFGIPALLFVRASAEPYRTSWPALSTYPGLAETPYKLRLRASICSNCLAPVAFTLPYFHFEPLPRYSVCDGELQELLSISVSGFHPRLSEGMSDFF